MSEQFSKGPFPIGPICGALTLLLDTAVEKGMTPHDVLVDFTDEGALILSIVDGDQSLACVVQKSGRLSSLEAVHAINGNALHA